MQDQQNSAGRPSLFEGRLLRSRGWGWRLFFPLAAGYAAAVVPLSLQAMTGSDPWLPALSYPAAHARELLGGFGLAVICGYLLGIAPFWLRIGLASLWLGARLGWLLQPGSDLAIGLQALFGTAMALAFVPKFVGKGRKLRNLSMAPLLASLALAPTVLDLVGPSARDALLPAWVLLYAWLLAFMGGRLIAPAAAGAFDSQGEDLAARVQPTVEALIIIGFALAIVLSAMESLRPLAATLLVLTGALIAARLFRWRLWQIRGRVDLWCLGTGYAWLAAGCCLIGVALDAPARLIGSLHAVTVAALGVLTLNVMLRSALLRGDQRRLSHPLFVAGTVLLSGAAVLRIAASWMPPVPARQLLWIAAAAWSFAFARLLLTLLGRAAPRF